MTLEAKKIRKARKKEARQHERVLRRDMSGWVRVSCKAVCGCCKVFLWYRSMACAQAAAGTACLRHVELTDDKGHTHRIDGFGGFEFVQLR